MKKHDANNELGRRLAAAYISYVLGRKSIDRVLIHVPKEIENSAGHVRTARVHSLQPCVGQHKESYKSADSLT